MHTEWKDYKINLIDTPGLDDFIGEVISSLRVADTAVMLLEFLNMALRSEQNSSGITLKNLTSLSFLQSIISPIHS